MKKSYGVGINLSVERMDNSRQLQTDNDTRELIIIQ